MAIRPAPAFQAWLSEGLAGRLRVPVRVEWAAFPGLAMYSPTVDVAVGPFSVEEGTLGPDYDELVARHRRFLRDLLTLHTVNVQAYDASEETLDVDDVAYHNWNARCFIAIEIENKSSRKHLMGSAINAAALGRIGLAVGWDDTKVLQFVRLRRYLRALSTLGKNSFATANLLVLHRDQLVEALGAHPVRVRRPGSRS